MNSLQYSRLWLGAVLFGVGLAGAQPVRNPTGIDFSYAGYEAGGEAIPHVHAVLLVRPTGSDDTARLQSAIDHVARMPVGPDGFRGAVLLAPGHFVVGGQLRVNANGVVLRGSGDRETTIIAAGIGRRTLIQVGGESPPSVGQDLEITDDVPAGAKSLHIASAAGLQVGSRVVIRRPSTAAWIKSEGMSGLLGTFADQRVDWKLGSHDLRWERIVKRVDSAANEVELDAPVTFHIDRASGGGVVEAVQDNLPVTHVGVENLVLESAFDAANPKDEEHSWIAIALDNVEDTWVEGVTARHFVASAVRVDQWAREVTVENDRFEAPVSEEGGYRRQAFVIYGQQVLVRHCWSELGMNDFATGLLAAGPNVFLDCEAERSLEASGSFEGLAAGVLYENVDVPASRIQLLLDQTRAQAAGWTAVNSLIWNSKAITTDAMGPYDGYNYVVESAQPLYASELKARGRTLPGGFDLAKESGAGLPEWTDSTTPKEIAAVQHPFSIVGGRFVLDGEVAYGESQNEAWWHGNTSPEVSGRLTGSSITRWMPGQVAPGLTEDLPGLVSRLKKNGTIFYQAIPGLWYDHRRDEHTITRQQNGDVWAPFFEMPWARSGKGIAWDGLSRFDLTKYNPWYLERSRDFERLAGESGLIVFHNLYNTHDVLEIGPHWIDFPWRPANNVNDTGLPEPPPFKGGYTMAMDTVQPTVTKMNVGNEFYSVDYAPRKKLHRDYILHVLDQLGDQPDVVFTIGYQYAGPLAFQQFFLDTVAEWEQQHHRRVHVALIADKKITDAILSDPVRAKLVDVVDMRYWYYMANGKLFAPEAGQNRAYRDWITSTFGGPYTNFGPATTQQQLYRLVREYRDRYPGVALMPMENGAGPLPLLMGGAASPSSLRGEQVADPQLSTDKIVNAFVKQYLAKELMRMSPADGIAGNDWVLAGGAADPVLVYSRAGASVTLTKPLGARAYRGLWFNPATGTAGVEFDASGGAGTSLSKPDAKGWLLLLRPRP